jgi:hypothetical protein
MKHQAVIIHETKGLARTPHLERILALKMASVLKSFAPVTPAAPRCEEAHMLLKTTGTLMPPTWIF